MHLEGYEINLWHRKGINNFFINDWSREYFTMPSCQPQERILHHYLFFLVLPAAGILCCRWQDGGPGINNLFFVEPLAGCHPGFSSATTQSSINLLDIPAFLVAVGNGCRPAVQDVTMKDSSSTGCILFSVSYPVQPDGYDRELIVITALMQGFPVTRVIPPVGILSFISCDW